MDRLAIMSRINSDVDGTLCKFYYVFFYGAHNVTLHIIHCFARAQRASKRATKRGAGDSWSDAHECVCGENVAGACCCRLLILVGAATPLSPPSTRWPVS